MRPGSNGVVGQARARPGDRVAVAAREGLTGNDSSMRGGIWKTCHRLAAKENGGPQTLGSQSQQKDSRLNVAHGSTLWGCGIVVKSEHSTGRFSRGRPASAYGPDEGDTGIKALIHERDTCSLAVQ